MNKKRLFLWFILISLLLTVQCTVDDDQITSPSGGVDQYIVLKSFLANNGKYQVFTHGDSTEVKLTVIDSDGDPAYPFTVTFNAEKELGTITPTDSTDVNGIATAKFYSYSTPGIEIITASTGSKKDSLLLYLVNRVTTLALSINGDSTAILADGKAKVKITATAKDSLDNPQANLRIFFTTDHGTIPGSGLTNENGIVEVMLTSESDSLDVIATIRAGFEQFESAAARTDVTQNTEATPVTKHLKVFDDEPDIRGPRPLIKELSIEINESDVPVTTARVITSIISLEDTLQVTFKGVEVNVQRGKPVLLADGEDLADIVVTLVETTSGNPITNYAFNITATKGTIIGNTETDYTGRANLQLRSGTKAGISIITVSVGLVISQTEIEFKSADPTSFTVERSAQFGIADGISGITLTATIWDILNNPVEAEEVVFSATVGELDITSGLSNTNGQVTAFLTSIPSVYDSTSMVIARVSGYSELVDTVEVEFKGITVSAEAAPDTIVANGIQSTFITATVRRTTGFAGAIPDREVYFIPLSDLGSIDSPQITDANGVATAELTAGLFEGTEVILVIFGELEPDTVYVEFLPQGATTLELESDLQSVHADGVSTLELTAVATDTLDNPVSGILVYFNSNIPGHDQLSSITDNDGTARVDFPSFASNNNLSAWLYAGFMADNQNDYIPGGGYSLASKTAQLIRMNTPAPLILAQQNQAGQLIDSVAVEFIGITITAEAEDTLLVADGQNTTTITAEVKETETNITIRNQSVYFTTNRGTITPEDLTDDFGIAEAILTSARFPDTANVRVRYGSGLYDTVSVVYLNSDPVSISIMADQSSILANGLETATISSRVLDILGNPMQGEAVGFTTTLGTLSAIAAYSDENGLASVNLYSIADINTHTASVTATIPSNSALTDSLEIEFRGVSINTSASEMSITADGQSSTDITVALTETENPFPIANQVINFLPTNTNGTMPRTVTTDINGIATSTLTSGTLPGTAKIYISTGNSISGEVLEDSISIELLNHNPNQIIVIADEISILADGSSSTGISAQVVDTLGNPVFGINVSVTTNIGNLTSNTGSTDAEGFVYTTLASAPDSVNTTAQVIATCTNFSQIVDTTTITMRGLTLIVNAVPEQISADGSSTSTISINLRETGNNNPIPNTNIVLATSSGTIPSLITTNTSGLAEAQLTSNSVAGIATVTATVGISRSTTVEFISTAPDSMRIDVVNSSILANGSSITDITATVLDVLGNPIIGTLLNVSTNVGILSNSFIYTDILGEATVSLTSIASTTDTNAVVIYTVINDTLSLSDSASVEFRGITLNINASPTQIPANGIATAIITAGLQETTLGNPLIGTNIDWATTLGIIPASSVTNNLGFTSTILTSGMLPGQATVTANTGLTDSVNITFFPVFPTSINIISSNSSIVADGEATTTLIATVTDTLGNPVSGTAIGFTTASGTLSSSSVITNANGEAVVTLTSAVRTTDTTATVTGTLTDYSSVTTGIDITHRGLTLSVNADPTQIAADGNSTATISINLIETTNGNPVANKLLSFSTDLGSIASTATTNANGQATIILTAGVSVGTATVNINAGITGSTTVEFMSIEPKSIILSATETSIIADNSATSIITATVTDTLGNPVSGTAIGFTTASGTLSSSSVITNANGEAVVTLTSAVRTTDTTATVTGTVTDYSSVTTGIDVTHRGLTLSVNADPTQIAADGNSTATISINLIETTNGNPVANKLLSFSTDLGSIASTATTNANGQATIILTAGVSVGTATVNINAGITGSTTVEFMSIEPKSITLSATETSIIADNLAATTITATVSDTLGYPISGTAVNFTAGAGTLSSSSVTTDANGLAAVILTGTARASDTTVVTTAVVSGYPAVTENVSIDFRGLTLLVSADPTQILADGQSISTITVNLTETTNGNPVVNKLLVVTTNRGTIPAQGITGTTGQATIILTAGLSAGTATVNINAGVIGSTTVEFMSIEPKSITLSATETSIIADNLAATTITATVSDTLGNPISGTAVNFTAGAGTLSSSSVTTDANGLAAVILTGTARASDTTVVTTAVVSGYPAVTENVNIDFRGLTLLVSANPTRIPADGISTSTATIDLHETTNGNPLAGRDIALTTTKGTIPASNTTNTNGIVSVNLTSGVTAGTATITAIAGITDSTTVEFSDLSFTVTADGTTLLADGVSSLQIRALLQDQTTGNPLTAKTIYWTTTLGSIPTSSTTDANGEALASLTAGITAGTAKVKGYYGTSLVDSVSITINATTDSTIILSWFNTGGNPGDGTEVLSVTAILSDGNGNPVSGNTIVFSVTPTSFGSITSGVTTGADGTATALYTYSSQFADQTVRVQATSQSGDITSYIDIILPEVN